MIDTSPVTPDNLHEHLQQGFALIADGLTRHREVFQNHMIGDRQRVDELHEKLDTISSQLSDITDCLARMSR